MNFAYTRDDVFSKRALLPVQFQMDDSSWTELLLQIDTAADITVLPYNFAVALRYTGLQSPLLVREVVGSLAALRTSVSARIVGKVVDLPIITSTYIIDPLLGVAGFVDNFETRFRPEGFEVIPL